MIHSATLLSLPIPLDRDAYSTAARFAAEQATLGKGKQVYLNTLAIYAVHTYFKWLEIETDLTQSDCWQPELRAILNIADLTVPGIGKLECCAVLPGADSFTVPLEAVPERVGYVAVQFYEQLDSVELLGFVRASTDSETVTEPPTIHQSDLLPLDSLLDFLHPQEAIVNLREWLENLFEQPEWQPLETLVPARFRNSTSGSRSASGGSSSFTSGSEGQVKSVSRAKTIELRQLQKNVVLVVQIFTTATEEDILNIRLRVYPVDSSSYLPHNLKVTALDESGSIVLESKPRDESVWTELELLDCYPGERFSVRISLGDSSVIEEFCI